MRRFRNVHSGLPLRTRKVTPKQDVIIWCPVLQEAKDIRRARQRDIEVEGLCVLLNLRLAGVQFMVRMLECVADRSDQVAQYTICVREDDLAIWIGTLIRLTFKSTAVRKFL